MEWPWHKSMSWRSHGAMVAWCELGRSGFWGILFIGKIRLKNRNFKWSQFDLTILRMRFLAVQLIGDLPVFREYWAGSCFGTPRAGLVDRKNDNAFFIRWKWWSNESWKLFVGVYRSSSYSTRKWTHEEIAKDGQVDVVYLFSSVWIYRALVRGWWILESDWRSR